MSPLWGALICLFFGSCFGAWWLLEHIGPGWPPSQHDLKPGERRAIGVVSLGLLVGALVLVILNLVRL